ncbi:MAG: disulfide bond formation protein B [Campylobacterales bacterium]|nr:disulfide bond formation protein B [Campylobacterales bacterium]
MTPSPSSSQQIWLILFMSWLIAMISTLGSLFFSEVMLFPPCVMCWYQRICMYPLVLIFFIALFSNDKNVFKYAMPLVLIGLFFALYHNLLSWGVLPESAAPCTQGVSCTSEYINWFGFISIQFLSLSAFALLFILLLCLKKKDTK